MKGEQTEKRTPGGEGVAFRICCKPLHPLLCSDRSLFSAKRGYSG